MILLICDVCYRPTFGAPDFSVDKYMCHDCLPGENVFEKVKNFMTYVYS